MAVANANGTGPYSQTVYGVTCDGGEPCEHTHTHTLSHTHTHTHTLTHYFHLTVAPPPNITQLEAVNSTAIRLAWQQLDSEDVPGMLVNYNITYTLDDNDITLPVPPERLVMMS